VPAHRPCAAHFRHLGLHSNALALDRGASMKERGRMGNEKRHGDQRRIGKNRTHPTAHAESASGISCLQSVWELSLETRESPDTLHMHATDADRPSGQSASRRSRTPSWCSTPRTHTREWQRSALTGGPENHVTTHGARVLYVICLKGRLSQQDSRSGPRFLPSPGRGPVDSDPGR